jgi:hypothetical protein
MVALSHQLLELTAVDHQLHSFQPQFPLQFHHLLFHLAQLQKLPSLALRLHLTPLVPLITIPLLNQPHQEMELRQFQAN